MSKTIDERVVEMRFDNQQFERNVATTMSTLDKLKKSLNLTGASKGLENVGAAAKNVNMSGLGTAVETVRMKFSALEVMGVTALANITNSAINAGKQLVKSLSVDQVMAGWNKYDQKTSSVQTIMNATGKSIDEVNGYLDKLMWFSDETSYGFTDMTQALGQLTSAGGNIEKLVPMIEGIANATAFAGKGANEFSRAIYNLNQSYSAGYLQYMDWRSLELAGVASKQLKEIFIETAVAQGKVADGQITLANFSETLKDKWADTAVMEAAFGKFAEMTEKAYEMVNSGEVETASEAYEILSKQYDGISITAAKAAQEAKTFTEAIDATKDAVSSGWMKTFELIFGNYEEAKVLWTDLANGLWDFFASGAEDRNEMLAGALNSKWSNLTKQIEDAGVSMDAFEGKVIETAKEHGIAIDKIIEDNGSLEKAFASGELSTSLIIETLKDFAGIESETSKTTGDLTGKLEEFQKVVDDVWRGDYGNADTGRFEKLKQAGYDYAVVQELVNKTVDGHRLTLEDLMEVQANMSDEQLVSIGYTEEQIEALRALAKQAEETGTPLNELIKSLSKPSGRELLIESVKNVLRGFVAVVNSVKEAWRDIFPATTSEQLYNMISALHKFTTYLVPSEKTISKLTRTFKGLFAILDVGREIVTELAKTGFSLLSKIVGGIDIDILEMTGSVGDMLVAFRDWVIENDYVAKGISLVVDTISSAIDTVKQWIKAFADIPVIRKNLDKLRIAFSNAYNTIKNFITGLKEGKITMSDIASEFSKIGEAIVDGLLNGLGDRGREVVESMLEFGRKIVNTIKDFLGIHSPSTVMYEIGKNIVEGLVNGVKAGIGLISGVVKEIADTITNTLRNIDWSVATPLIIGAGVLYVFKKMSDAISNLANILTVIGAPLKALDRLSSGAQEVLKSFAKSIDAKSWYVKAKAVQTLAISLLILVGAIYVLTKIRWQDLLVAVIALGALAGIIGALSYAVGHSGFTDVKEFGKFALVIVAISASLFILAAAIEKVASIDGEDLQRSVFSILGVMSGMILMAYAFDNFSDGLTALGKADIGSTLLKMVVAIGLMAIVIKMISGIDDADISKGIKTMSAFVMMIMVLLGSTSFAGKEIDAIGWTIVKLSAAMMLMVGVIKLISFLKPEEILKGIITMGFMTILIGALVLVARLADGKELASVGTTIFGISASMLMLVGVMKVAAMLRPEEFLKGAAAITVFTVIIMLLIKAVKITADQDAIKIGATMLAVSAAIGILAGIAVLLSLIDLKGLAKGVTAVSILGLVMAVMIKACKGVESNAYSMKTVMMMAIAIGVMAAAVAGLSFIDTQKLMVATVSLGTLMGVFALMIKATEMAKSSIGSAIVMTIAVVALGGVLFLIGQLEPENALAASASLSMLMLAMAATFAIVGKTGPIAKSSVGALALMGLVVGELAIILGALSLLDAEPSIESAVSLSILLLAMSGALAILTPIGPVAELAIPAAVALIAFVGIIGAFMIAVGALMKYVPAAEEFLDKGIVVLEKIGYGLGAFFGNIIGGFVGNIGSGLPELANDLSSFMENLQPFIDGANSIDPSVSDNVKTLSEAISTLIKSNLLDGIASWVNGGSSIASFGTELATLGEGINQFITNLGTFSEDQVASVECACKAISILSETAKGIDGQSEWSKALFGDNSLAAFGAQFGALGTNLNAFVTNLGTFTEEQVTTVQSAADAITTLANAAETIPNEGGWAAKIFGDNSLASFGAQLPGLGTNLSSFATNLGAFTEEQVNSISCACDAITAMSNAASNVNGQADWAVKLFGDNSLATFGSQLPGLGTNLSSFVTNLGTFSEEQVASVACAGDAIVSLAKASESIPNEGGWISKILGDNSLATFGSQLPALGTNLAAFVTNLGIFTEDQVSTVKCAGEAIKALAQAAQGIDGQADWAAKIFGDNSLATFSTQFGTLGTNLAAFVTNLGVFTEEQVATVRSAVSAIRAFSTLAECDLATATANISGFGDKMVELATDISDFCDNLTGTETIDTAISNIKSIMNAINEIGAANFSAATDFMSALQKIGEDGVEKFVSAFTSKSAQTDVKKALEDLLDAGIKAAKGKKSDVKDAFEEIAEKGADAITKKKSDYKSAGKALVEGLRDGINENAYMVSLASTAMMTAAIAAAEAAAGIQSPSKVMYQVGEYFGMGFTNAVDDYGAKAYKSSYEMANYAVNGMSNAISKIQDFIDSDIDPNPTISPVLDLTNVKDGVNRIGSMLDTSPSVGVVARVGAISTRMNQNGQNGESEVVSAINGLRKDLSKLESTTNNINGITYDDGSNITDAIKTIVRVARIERRT